MRIILYECKKILKLPLLVIIILFTLLFYNLFMDSQYYPNDDASLAAGVDLAHILMDKYQTVLPYSEMGILQEIKQQQLQSLDALVQHNEVLQNAGVKDYQQLRGMDMDAVGKEIQEAFWEIDFDKGIREVFLYQGIDNIEEHMEYAPFMGIEKGREEEAAKKICESQIAQDGDEATIKRVAQVIARNEMSLLPTGAFNRMAEDSSKFGVLLLFSCLILILPYQIRERLAHVNPLFATTNTGRGIFGKRYIAAVLSCLLVCLLQAGAFLSVLFKVGILKYRFCPASGNGWDYLWFDMSFGGYLTLSISITILFNIAIVSVFYLISRIALNYIVGLAIGLPTAILIGILYIKVMNYFLFVGHLRQLYVQFGFIAGGLLLAAMIVVILHFRDRKRDVMV